MTVAFIGEYTLYYTDDSPEFITVYPTDSAKEHYEEIPSAEECNDAIGTSDLLLKVRFNGCNNLKASPKLPDEVYSFTDVFYGTQLGIAPKLPKRTSGVGYVGYYRWAFDQLSIKTPAVIPVSADNIGYMYYRCESLLSPASVPNNVTVMTGLYDHCSSIGGEFCIRISSATLYNYALRETVEPITIYGDKAFCETIAASANNGNASWQPWYDPVPAVTDRGQGSYTTADDMTRMVRNGVLAVDSYAPGRMVYHQGDIVREDEWEALVEAAQTIDPTVTMSTHYTNLNKIEKAFDDAL